MSTPESNAAPAHPQPSDIEDLFVTPSIRPRCPFYGFIGIQGVLVDNRGNACGCTGEHRPCLMEMNSETPNWLMCKHFNNEKNRAAIRQALDCGRIFPEELRPAGSSSWEGVSLRGWFEFILR